MSPTSSIPSTTAATSQARPVKPPHSRHASSATIPQAQQETSKPSSPRPAPIDNKPDVHYTVFIRLPFARGDFVDPEPVEWDGVKDRALWKIVSKSSNTKELDWPSIAQKFEVGLPFLLQQAAWLYERHFEGMRKQMQRLSASGAPSPVPSLSAGVAAGQGDGGGSGASSGTVPAHTTGSGGLAVGLGRRGSRDSRMPSVINTLKAHSAAAGGSEGSSPGTPRSAHPPISRTPSTTTVTQSRLLSGSSGTGKQPLQRAFRGSSSSQRRPTAFGRPAADAANVGQEDDDELAHEGPSDSESEEEPRMARSQAFRRPALLAGKKSTGLGTLSSEGDEGEEGEDEADSSGGYLPFAAAMKAGKEDQTITLKSTIAAKRQSSGAGIQPAPAAATTSRKPTKAEQHPPPPSSSASSASSALPAPSSSTSDPVSSQGNLNITGQPPRPPGPLSPRHRAQLTNTSLSPGRRRDGSEGSPSMGSSFSDLDDASVTQSALEDALLSMQQAGNASGLSSLGGLQGLGSRVRGLGGGGGGRRG